jgi:hypothetical protein
MQSLRTLAIATAAIIAAWAAPAKAATITSYKVAGWNMGAYTNDQTRRFTHCAASAQYRNGLLLLFSVSESFQWSIGFSNQDWSLRPGREIDVEFQIDGGRTHSVRGTVATEKLLRARLPDNVELFNQFRVGLRLVVSLNDNAPVTFNLTDTNAMLTEILQCARKYKDYAERTDNRPNSGLTERDLGPVAPRSENRTSPQPQSGFGSGSTRRDNNKDENRDDRRDSQNARMPDRYNDMPPMDRAPSQPPIAPAVGPTPETRTEATRIATDVLRRANFTFEFQKPEQLNAGQRDKFDAVWRADGLLGTLRILPGVRADTFESTRTDLISSDTKACKGKLDSGVLPAAADTKSVTMFTACKGETLQSTYYILLHRRQGGVYLFGITGSGDAAANLQSVAGAYRTVALEVVEK